MRVGVGVRHGHLQEVAELVGPAVVVEWEHRLRDCWVECFHRSCGKSIAINHQMSPIRADVSPNVILIKSIEDALTQGATGRPSSRRMV